MNSKLKYSDIILGVFVVGITAMLLVPLPTHLLDFLLVINISIALLVLLAGLYMPNALSLFAFPSLLLLTTLFRLGLNVAVTRLILSQADAGQVIQAFGSFLIRGQITVGVLIFLIITIVNFIVIARGSTRVSEVAARFALDALPGKQMAIDSDLRAGMITAEEALRKRDELRRESQTYGAMDGAMKFVQGDAIAGLFIIVVNILGGIYMGVSEGMSFQDAIQTYTTLTVGDGLVNQIPALLISICAGIIVTRVSSGENTSLGVDVGAQLLSKPGTIFFAGLILLFLGLIPSIPHLPFLTVGFGLVGMALLLRRAQNKTGELPLKRSATLDFRPTQALSMPASYAEEGASDTPVLVFELDNFVLYKTFRNNAQKYRLVWEAMQNDFYNRLGLKLPNYNVIASDSLSAAQYEICFQDSLIEKGSLPLDALLIETSRQNAQILGFKVLREEEHPLNCSKIFWTENNSHARQIADDAQIRCFDFLEYLFLRSALYLERHPEEILTLADVHNLIKQMEKKHPGLVMEALGRNFITPSRLTQLMLELVRQGLSVKDLKQILEAVASYISKYVTTDEVEFDLEGIVDHIRGLRRKHILGPLLSQRETLRVCTLSHEVEEVLEQTNFTTSFALAPETLDNMQKGLSLITEPLQSRGNAQMALLCRADLRHNLLSFLTKCNNFLKVITFEELDPVIKLEPVGVWKMPSMEPLVY